MTMRSEVRKAVAAVDLAAERRADEEASAKGRRGLGVAGVLVFGLMTLFCVIGVAGLASKGSADAGFWVLLVSLPVNTLWLGKCWRMMWSGVGD